MMETAALADPATNACTRCGTFFKGGRDVMYSNAGDKVCAACFEVGELDAAKTRYANTLRNGGYAAPFFAAVSVMATLVFSALAILLMGVAAISAGGILVAIARDAEVRRRMGWHLVPVCVSAALAILIAGGLAVVFLLGFGLLMATPTG